MTGDERLFVQEWFRTGNPTKAYLAVWPFTAKNTAPKLALALLNQPHIQLERDRWQDHMNRRFNISRDRVMQEIARIAFFDIGMIYDDEGKLKKVRDMDADTRAAILAVEEMHIGDGMKVVKIKTVNKLDALRALVTTNGYAVTKPTDDSASGNPLDVLLSQIGQRSALPVVQLEGQVEEEE